MFIGKIFTAALLNLVFTWEIPIQDECPCSELKLQQECDWNFSCSWDDSSKTCLNQEKFPCSSYFDEYKCKEEPHCYHDEKNYKCEDFTSCEKIPFTDAVDCWNSKPGCVYYKSIDKCSKLECSKFSEDECPSEYQCYLSDNKCTEYTCANYNKQLCPTQNRCVVDGDDCRQAICQDYTQDECWYVMNLEKHVVETCIVDGNRKCVEGQSEAQLTNPLDCFWHTRKYYHWSTADQNNGKCIACSAPNPYPTFGLVLILGYWILLN